MHSTISHYYWPGSDPRGIDHAITFITKHCTCRCLSISITPHMSHCLDMLKGRCTQLHISNGSGNKTREHVTSLERRQTDCLHLVCYEVHLNFCSICQGSKIQKFVWTGGRGCQEAASWRGLDTSVGIPECGQGCMAVSFWATVVYTWQYWFLTLCKGAM